MLRKIARVLKNEGAYGIVNILIIKIFRWKAVISQLLGQKEIRSRYGIRISVNPCDATFNHYVSGVYGFYYWNRIRGISTKFVFLDIGANQGLYTICAALNPNIEKCFAFEPVDETFHLLEKNININGVANKCTLIKKPFQIR